jgi:hypothetical protein
MNNFNQLVMLTLVFALIVRHTTAQSKLVINGGVITITKGAALIIDNPNNTAITNIGEGYIQSEGASNNVVRAFGPGNGNTYKVPLRNRVNNFPLQFNAASGTGVNSQIVFRTYSTSNWKSSDYLPPGVTVLGKRSYFTRFKIN